MKKYFWLALLLIAILLGILFRVYDIGSTFFFEGELGKELLYMQQFSLKGGLPIIGMPTSHEWLSYGPIYYWIMIPVFNLFNGNPYILFWSALVVSVIGLIINWAVLKQIVGQKVATISTLLASISPLLIWQTRNSKLHVFFFILSPLLMYALWKVWNGNKSWVFWAGIIFGLMFSFHFSQIPLLLVVAFLFYLKKKEYKFRDWIKFIVGVAIPNLTLIWQDKSLALWLPYRIANLAVKNPMGTIESLTEYFGRNMFWNANLWVIGLIVFLAVFAHYVYIYRQKFTKEFLPFFLISSIGVTVIANILHGAPPVHYFLPIFTTIPILFASHLEKYKYWYLPIFVVYLINLPSYFNIQKADGFIPLYKQEAIANFIIADSKGKTLSINRIGPYDYFPEDYSQNYKYLFLWKGGNLSVDAGNIYTIMESENGTQLGVVKK